MEELSVLKEHIRAGRYGDALTVIEELEEMSKQDKLNAIHSFLIRLLTHLIKCYAEGRLTGSWAASIASSVDEIRTRNRCDNGTHYIKSGEWEAQVEQAFRRALREAAVEAFGGISPAILSERIDHTTVMAKAVIFLELSYEKNQDQFDAELDDHLAALPGGDAWIGRRGEI